MVALLEMKMILTSVVPSQLTWYLTDSSLFSSNNFSFVGLLIYNCVFCRFLTAEKN